MAPCRRQLNRRSGCCWPSGRTPSNTGSRRRSTARWTTTTGTGGSNSSCRGGFCSSWKIKSESLPKMCFSHSTCMQVLWNYLHLMIFFFCYRPLYLRGRGFFFRDIVQYTCVLGSDLSKKLYLMLLEKSGYSGFFRRLSHALVFLMDSWGGLAWDAQFLLDSGWNSMLFRKSNTFFYVGSWQCKASVQRHVRQKQMKEKKKLTYGIFVAFSSTVFNLSNLATEVLLMLLFKREFKEQTVTAGKGSFVAISPWNN